MLQQLEAAQRRQQELLHKLQEPGAASDPALYAALMKDYQRLDPIVQAYLEYKAAEKDYTEAKELLDSGSLDPEFKAIVQQQLCENRDKLEPMRQKLKILLLPHDPNDEKSVIVEIRSGAGGEEAALFARSVFRMYSMYAARQNWRVEILNENDTELGGIKEISFMIDGENVYSRMKFESGVHRVQRVPETETQGRIHTSTITVAVMPKAEPVEFDLDPKDLKIDTFRASGAGGQHINKTSSAIRVTHLPTGTVVECQNERSQFQNKDKALEILRSRLLQQKQEAQQQRINADRHSQVGTGDRSERIRTYNFPQRRVTDHRVNLSLYKIEDIMNGDLQEIIDALITAEQAEKLNATGELE